DPIEIIKILTQKFKFNEIYLADLDAIIKKKPNLKLLSKILEIPRAKIALDPGIANKENLLIYSRFKLNKLILGLETIREYDVITEGLKIFTPNKLIISIDMYKKKIISNIKELKGQNPLNVIDLLEEFNIKELILLDLFRVGQKIGGIPPLYLKIRKIFNGNILVGGGIRDYKDVIMYRENNFSGVLIATALYDKSIIIDKLRNF
ncbi:MAG: HisA/HisF-related TIM barrel protein, partial [Promethearchaeota archaeon]